MSAVTSIEWTDRTWNPTRGCSHVSEGCRNCYAERLAWRFRDGAYSGLTTLHPNGEPRWNGKILLVPEALEQPLRWRKPSRIFVDSMSDLFHEEVPDEFIAAVFGVALLAPHHTLQILTKRAERLPAFMQALTESARGPISECLAALYVTHPEIARRWPLTKGRAVVAGQTRWPLPNVWLGVSVENQDAADERIPLLLRTPAAVRFLSIEPMLGPVDLTMALEAFQSHDAGLNRNPAPVHWVIVVGESGPNARPCDLAWIRSIVAQCRRRRSSCFVKQMGRYPVCREPSGSGPEVIRDQSRIDREWPRGTHFGNPTQNPKISGRIALLRDRKGSDFNEFPADLRIREWPEERAAVAARLREMALLNDDKGIVAKIAAENEELALKGATLEAELAAERKKRNQLARELADQRDRAVDYAEWRKARYANEHIEALQAELVAEREKAAALEKRLALASADRDKLRR